MKRRQSPAELQRRRDAGKACAKALKREYGEDYFCRLGRSGGRPTHAESVAKAHRQAEEAHRRAKQTGKGVDMEGGGASTHAGLVNI